MKQYIYSALCIAGALSLVSCDDYLETSSPSVVDADFVFSNPTTARGAMDGAYETWRDAAQNSFFGDGLYYAADIAGSDIERHPEAFTNQPGRHYPECFYQNGTYTGSYNLLSYLKEGGVYDTGFAVVGKANSIITAMEAASNFDDIVTNATEPSPLSQMYGEAVAMRATAYRELIKYWGDVPFSDTFGEVAMGITSRDSIYDKIIADLVKVEPLMYPVGSIPGVDGTKKNYFSRTYVDGLIGRLCLEAGGFQTRRTDLGSDFYKDGEGNVLTFEKLGKDHNNATYTRRSDWKKLYEMAKTYFKKAIDNPGSAKFYTTDPRPADKTGRKYDNPYQYFFQQMHEADAVYADESIYEYAMQQGGGNDGRPYSFGRPSSGGSKNAFPCKSYGQGRINPAYYYGVFAPNDKRRDVSVCVTGSDGKGNEKLISFKGGSKADAGGLTLNKWDECRQAQPWVAAQRKSGINGPYMRMAEMYLGYAEACAATGDDANALSALRTVRERSFKAGEAKTDEFVAKVGADAYLSSSECAQWPALYRAIIEERGFEFAGEGDRRWTLIRTGLIGGAIHRVKDMTKKMLDGLKANGYYAFDNGNVISNYIWTKSVDAKATHGFRLTAECTDTSDPVLYPGWRGQNDDWAAFGCKYSGTATPNLAIKGLFNYIAPGSAEATALENDGYKKVDWAVNISEQEYYTNLFLDYDYVSAPIYLWPFTPNTISTGGFTNGYGFKNE